MKKLLIGILTLIPAIGQASPVFGYILNAEKKSCDPLPTGVSITRMHAYFSKEEKGCSLEKLDNEGVYDIYCKKADTHYFIAGNELGCVDALKMFTHTGDSK